MSADTHRPYGRSGDPTPDPMWIQSVGPGVTFKVRGLEQTIPATRSWAAMLFAPLPAWSTSSEQAIEVPIHFEHDLGRPTDRYQPHPLAYTDQGIHVAPLGGGGAIIPLADIGRTPIRVDGSTDLTTFLDWVHLPVLRTLLWDRSCCLVRATAVEFDGRRIAWSAPGGSGKTSLLLAFLRRGARYLGDDWIWMDVDGHVGPISRLIAFRDQHRPYVRRSTLHTSPVRRAAVTAAGWGAGRTHRWPRLSAGLSRVAEAGWRLGTHFGEVVTTTGAAVGEPGPLDTLAVLTPPRAKAPDYPLVAERMAANSRLDGGRWNAVDAAYRVAHPGRVGPRTFPTIVDERDLLDAALVRTKVMVIPSASRTTSELADRLITESTR